MTREALFECTYASAAQRRTVVIRAWDAREAVELFAKELREDGIADRGEISVRARGDDAASRSSYQLK